MNQPRRRWIQPVSAEAAIRCLASPRATALPETKAHRTTFGGHRVRTHESVFSAVQRENNGFVCRVTDAFEASDLLDRLRRRATLTLL